MDTPRPKGRLLSRPRVALGIALLIGIGLGILLDRAFIRFRSKTSVKSQIVGKWVSTANEEPLEINADGTYDWERYYLDISTGKMIGRPAAGQWRLLECIPAWEGNGSSDSFIAFEWEHPDGTRLLAPVNYSDHYSQCYVRLPDVKNGNWVCAI